MQKYKRPLIQLGISIALVLIATFLLSQYNSTEANAIIQGHAGVAQLSDNPTTATVSQYVQTHDVVSLVIWGVVVILIILVWIVPFIVSKKTHRKRTFHV